MSSSRVFVIAVAVVFSAQLASAQDLTRYRTYVLESSLESVVAVTEGRAADARTLHARPAKIQEFEWRAPYTSASSGPADPVKGAVFSFYNDALYQIVVTYDSGRTDGLTDGDIIESLTTVYGTPVPKSAKARPQAVLPDTVVLAQWDSTASSVALLRGAYSTEFQLVLTSKALSTRAKTAIREAERLDVIDAPRRESEQRKKEIAESEVARDKIRATNKAAFRP